MQFKEVQKFNQLWLWLLFLALFLGAGYIIYRQLILEIPIGDQPASNTELILIAVSLCLLCLLFVVMKLETEISSEGIRMRFIPFVQKRVKWDQVEKAEVLNYGFVGGWGIRVWTRYGTVYNTKGRMGLAIRLKSGKKFLIGTQKPEELKVVVHQYLRNESGIAIPKDEI